MSPSAVGPSLIVGMMITLFPIVSTVSSFRRLGILGGSEGLVLNSGEGGMMIQVYLDV